MRDDYDSFFATHYERVRRVLSVTVGDADLGEDATQEAFARAYRKWSRVSVMDNPLGWVLVVGSNHARRRRRRRVLPRSVTDRVSPPETRSIDDRMVVDDLLERLTPRQRAAVALRYLADLPYAQVADALSCSESTARVTVHQAVSKLRQHTGESTR